ncbi:MAG: c-type cytochrome [Burkholderiales bacterium]|nr:c-type cytochrome [Burkholderiales bacterium]
MIRFIALLVTLTMPAAAFAAERGDAAAGKQIATKICAACHGIDGNSPLSTNPNLAGQHADYLYKQLAEYKSGARPNAIMLGMIVSLSEQDMRNVSAYYSGQTAKQGMAVDVGLAMTGQQLYRAGIAEKGVAACSACHSPDGSGIPPQYPSVSGQHAEYTAAQLRAFRAGSRDNDINAMMRTVASRLSDEEIKALAEYISGLH